MGKPQKHREKHKRDIAKGAFLTLPIRHENGSIEKKNVPVWGLSCQHRNDRRQHVDNEWHNAGLGTINWIIVEKHSTNPKQGCWESHQKMWKRGIDLKLDWLCIIEDDATWIGSPKNFPPLPISAQMAYLGGIVNWTWEDPIQEASHWDRGNLKISQSEWIRAITWTTHGYFIHLGALCSRLTDFINMQYNEGNEVDRFFVEQIHPHEECYIIRNMRMIQSCDYSDIEHRRVDYSPMIHSAWGIPKPYMERGSQGELCVPLAPIIEEKLPRISIITPTYRRAHIFGWALRNFYTQYYPPELMEWIIVEEDNDSKTETVKQDLPDDPRIRRIGIKPREDGNPQTIAYKRNVGIKESANNLIVFMDDDDYYPPTSVIARVKALLQYRGKLIVGTSLVACFDPATETSGFISDGRLALSEASMAFWKRAWIDQPFNPEEERGEYRSFLNNRWDQCLDIPSVFIIYALRWAHHARVLEEAIRNGDQPKRPMCGAVWKETKRGESVDFRLWWDKETVEWHTRFWKLDQQYTSARLEEK